MVIVVLVKEANYHNKIECKSRKDEIYQFLHEKKRKFLPSPTDIILPSNNGSLPDHRHTHCPYYPSTPIETGNPPYRDAFGRPGPSRRLGSAHSQTLNEDDDGDDMA